jgi:hypothetical protein
MRRYFMMFGRTLAASLVLLVPQAVALQSRLGYADDVAYGLPAANWVCGKPFATPQVGDQYGIDRAWRFSSPVMGGGAAPFLWAFGVSSSSYAVAVATAGGIAAVVFLGLLRRAVPGVGWWVIILAVGGFLLTLVYLSEFHNHRLAVLAYPAVGLLFWPRASAVNAAPWWQWTLAGFLPLIHPALLIGSIVWILAEIRVAARLRIVSAIGLTGFLAGVGACAIWYLDPNTFSTQFLPHLRSRTFTPFSGWGQPASWKYALPSQVALATVLVMAALAVTTASGSGYRGCGRVLGVLTLVLALDAIGYMNFLPFYVIGLAPVVIHLLSGTKWQFRFVVGLAGLALVHLAVAVKLDPWSVRRPVTADEARGFLLEHTGPGDVIVVGPPFVFAASGSAAVEGRGIPYVVPVALYLDGFDEDGYLAAIRSSATVYVGYPEYFAGVMRDYKPTSNPIFPDGLQRMVDFRGDQVLVARPEIVVRGLVQP